MIKQSSGTLFNRNMVYAIFFIILPLIVLGGWGMEIHHAPQNLVKSEHNNTVLIKQRSLFDTALVITNHFEFKISKKKNF